MDNEDFTRYLGIATRDYWRQGVEGQQVEWIAWDSPVLHSLEIGDVVIAIRTGAQEVTGRAIPRFSYPYVNEHEIWSALESPGGESLMMTVVRQGESLSVRIQPSTRSPFQNDSGKRSLFPGGPYYLANDGFRESWSGWYENIIKEWSHILTDGWRAHNFNSRRLLTAHQDERRRIDLLLEKYPGDFADHMALMWQRVDENLRCTAWPSVDLEYREFEKVRIGAFQAAARAAHQQFREQLGDELHAAFPAPNPYDEDATDNAGKLVCVERVSPRDMRGNGAQAWYIMGGRYDGWYFLSANSVEVRRLGDCILKYQNEVSPQLAERYTFFLRVLDQPMMRPLERRNVVRGFQTQLVAALIGDAMFVRDLDTDTPIMAGADLLAANAIALPSPGASPEDIVKARVEAVKWSRRDIWSAMLADWTLSTDWGGHPVFLPYAAGTNDRQAHWEQSRKRLFGDVLDVRVTGRSPVYTVAEADETTGMPQIEETEVRVEHIGEFDDSLHTFKDNWLTRYWRLQRIDGGDWRIVYPGAL